MARLGYHYGIREHSSLNDDVSQAEVKLSSVELRLVEILCEHHLRMQCTTKWRIKSQATIC